MALSLVGPVRALASISESRGGSAENNAATAVSQAIRDSLTLVMDMQREHWRDASDEYGVDVFDVSHACAVDSCGGGVSCAPSGKLTALLRSTSNSNDPTNASPPPFVYRASNVEDATALPLSFTLHLPDALMVEAVQITFDSTASLPASASMMAGVSEGRLVPVAAMEAPAAGAPPAKQSVIALTPGSGEPTIANLLRIDLTGFRHDAGVAAPPKVGDMVVPGAEWSAGVVHGAGKVVAVQVTTAQPATIKVSWPAGGPGMPPGAVTTHRQGMDAITKNVFAELEPADKQLSIKAVNVYVRPVNSLLRPSSITSTGGAGAQALAALLRLVNQVC